VLAITLGGFQLQVFAALLKRGLDRPPLRLTLLDLFGAQAQSSREQILVTICTCTSMDVYPTYRDQGLPDAVPVAGAGDDRDVSAGSSIPGHREACAVPRVRHHLLRGGKFLAFHARAADRAAYAGWRRLIQGGIAIKLADQREATAVLMAKSRRLARAVTRVAHEDGVTLWDPAHQARQQQPGEVRRRLMPCAVQGIPLRRALQGHQDGQRPGRVPHGSLTSTDNTTHLWPQR
jgi:hypothetical protein